MDNKFMQTRNPDGTISIKKSDQEIGEHDSVVAPEDPNQNYGIASLVKSFIDDCIGEFTLTQLDKELGFTAEDAGARRAAIHRFAKKGIIVAVGTGRYRKTEATIERIIMKGHEVDEFDVKLPLGLSDLVAIPRKSIVVIAGTSNAGKTQFMFDLLRLNIDAPEQPLYLMTEMSPNAYRKRAGYVCNGDENLLNKWDKNIFGAEAVFEQMPTAIAQYAPNGISIIDFLEIQGEYYDVRKEIRQIYDSLTGGVCFIALQKKSGERVGRGGEQSKEKARLYLTMDAMGEVKDGTLVHMRIEKAKEPREYNVNGMEIHLLTTKNRIIPLSDWMHPMNDKDREMVFGKYKTDSAGDRLVNSLNPTPLIQKEEVDDVFARELKQECLSI